MRPALVKRLLQFRAGPQTQTFYACWEHARKLEGDTDVANFMQSVGHHIQGVEPSERDDAGCNCDFCE